LSEKRQFICRLEKLTFNVANSMISPKSDNAFGFCILALYIDSLSNARQYSHIIKSIIT